MEFQFCGAAGSVTGSKHYVLCDNFQFLVDCGLVQERSKAHQNWEPFLENVSALNAVLLTHAHLDHCGLLPKLVADGFAGNIYGTPATLDLAKLILLDSAHIQEEDANFKRKRHAKEQRIPPRPVRPLYKRSDVEATVELFQPIPYSTPTKIAPGVTIEFFEAGHILGSAFIEVTIEAPQIAGSKERRLLFSGDLGRANRPILRNPEYYVKSNEISNLFLESTYGDRLSGPIDSVNDQLADVISRTINRGGKIISPVFAVERAQEILCRLAELRTEGRIPKNVPIFLDSPMAVEATMIFSRHKECFDEKTLSLLQDAKETLKDLHLLRTTEESKQLNEMKGPAIILASSGMCNAGRIKHHLANHIGNDKNTIVFLGYQAEGTLGRQIINGVSPVRILGEPRDVRAEIVVVRGISGHADQSELLAWFEAIPQTPLTTFIVHGETKASNALAEKIRKKQPQALVHIPTHLEIYRD